MYTEIYLLVLSTGIACVALLAWGLWLEKTTKVEHHTEDSTETELKKAA